MKHALIAALFGAALASAAAADPIFGTWQTAKDDNGQFGHIEIKACGSEICGTLVRSFDASGTEAPGTMNGRKIIWDMRADGGGAYSGGKIYSPDRDKTYGSKLKLTGNRLNVSGCVLGVCRDGGTWTRVN